MTFLQILLFTSISYLSGYLTAKFFDERQYNRLQDEIQLIKHDYYDQWKEDTFYQLKHHLIESIDEYREQYIDND